MDLSLLSQILDAAGLEFDTLIKLWAAAIGTIGVITAILSVYFTQALKQRFGGVVGEAVNYVTVSISCTLTILVIYYTSGIYALLTGRDYPIILSHTVLNTLLSVDLILLYLAARTLKEGTDLKG